MNARQEAERRWPGIGRGQQVARGDRMRVNGFELGALWATSPDNTEAVEAVASALKAEAVSWGASAACGAVEHYGTEAKAALTALHELMKGENGD